MHLAGQCGEQMEALRQLPLLEVAESQKPLLIDDLPGTLGEIVCNPWPEPLRQFHLQPAGITSQGRYVLALGISPRLPFDEHYTDFFQLLANRICHLLESEAVQQERRMAELLRVQLFATVDEQRDLLSNIVESTPAGIAVLDEEFCIRWCNPSFCNSFDMPLDPASAIGRKLRDLVSSPDEVLRIVQRVRETHESFTAAEYEHVGFARGTTYWRWSLVWLRSGELLSVSTDVTDQVMARRKLATIAERLRLAQLAARIGTYYWQLSSGELEWSPEFLDVTGLDPARKASWSHYLSHVDPHDRPRLRRELEEIESEARVLRVHDHRLIDRFGRERWLALTGDVHADSDGVPESILGTVADITERKRAEKALEESKREAQQQWAELEAIYGTAPIGLALFDPAEFRYLRLNSRQAEMVGLPAEQILGRTLTEIAPIEGLQEMFEQVARGKPVINELLEGELPMSPGEHRYWTVNYFPVYDSEGHIQAISAASLEITAQKRAELALVQSEKIAAVGRLASSISHEINNPLEAVTNLLYLLRNEQLSGAGRQYLASAERELARVSNIATHTLRFHRQATRATEASAAELIDPILTLYQARLAVPRISVERNYRSQAKVTCFEGDMRQVLNNLIGNAIDAMRSGGRLLLRSKMVTDWPSGGRGLRITIADTGHGMDEVTRKRLFEAFYTTKGINGTGLGLWISSEIVRKHGGRLRFRSSRREGRQGTVFQLFLPLVPALLAEQAA
jgi:PAS domain S-box-containing protein